MSEHTELRDSSISSSPYLSAWRRAMTGDYRSHGDVRNVSCVMIFAFAERKIGGQVLPGLCNQQLARIAIERFSGKPMFLYYQVADALKELGYACGRSYGKRGRYYESRAFAVDALKDIVDEKLLDEGDVAILGHPHHLTRADMTTQRLLPDDRETVVPPDIHVDWDSEASQWRARSESNWRIYETPAMARSLAHGWLDPTYAAKSETV